MIGSIPTFHFAINIFLVIIGSKFAAFGRDSVINFSITLFLLDIHDALEHVISLGILGLFMFLGILDNPIEFRMILCRAHIAALGIVPRLRSQVLLPRRVHTDFCI